MTAHHPTLPDTKAEAGLELSVVVPCFNEENGVAAQLDRLLRVIPDIEPSSEIIVVDDGSSDRTPDILGDYADRVTVVRNATNRGYGAALKRGIRIACGHYVCIIDADGTYPSERIGDLFALIREQPLFMVVASRTGANVEIPAIRRPAKWFVGMLANYIAGEHIPDINSGLRIFERRAAQSMLDILPDGFSFTTTITLAMLTNGFGVKYVPTDYFHRVGRSKIRPIRDTLNFLQLIARMGLYFAPLKVFLPISGALLLFAVAWGIVTMVLLGRPADVSTLVIAMSGIQIGALGLLAELIRLRVPSPYSVRD